MPCGFAIVLIGDAYEFAAAGAAGLAAVAISLFYPAAAPGVLLCAFSVAISRVFLGMHF